MPRRQRHEKERQIGTIKEDLEQPDVSDLRQLFTGPISIQGLALVGLFILAIFYTLYLARSFLLPVVLAILLAFLLAPAVRWLSKHGLPRPFSAALILLTLLAVLGLGLHSTMDPAREWLGKAPRKLRQVERKVKKLLRPVEEVSAAARQVEKMAAISPENGQKVEVKQQPSLGESLFDGTQNLLFGGGAMLILLYFLLASGDLFLRKLVHLLPRLSDGKRVVRIAHQIQRDISTHLITITLINGALGVAIGFAMYWLGMPSPVLWGTVAAVFNFVPYLGAMVGCTIVAGVALLTFDAPVHALIIPAVYLALTSLEGSLITPMILGRRLALNSVAIVLGLFFWGWLWGIPGALLAVPLQLAIKIICDNVSTLAPIGAFLGR